MSGVNIKTTRHGYEVEALLFYRKGSSRRHVIFVDLDIDPTNINVPATGPLDAESIDTLIRQLEIAKDLLTGSLSLGEWK